MTVGDAYLPKERGSRDGDELLLTIYETLEVFFSFAIWSK
jgi:hypothetical protein